MTSSLIDLLDDILIHLFTIVTVSDILKLRQTCKRLSALSKLRIVWCTKFLAEVQQRQLPIPGNLLPLSDISGKDLEWRTRRALRLETQWKLPGANTSISLSLDLPEKHVREVILMPGGNAALTVHPDRISLWETEYHHSSIKSQRSMRHSADWFLPGSSTACHVVRDSALSSHIAVLCSNNSKGSSIHVLHVGESLFVAEKSYLPLVRGSLIGLHDDILLLDNSSVSELEANEDNGIILMHWRDPTSSSAILRPPPISGKYIAHTLFDSYFVVLWEFFLAIYPKPSGPFDVDTVIEPSQVFYLGQRIQRPASFTQCRPNTLPDTVSQHSGGDFLTIFARPTEKAWGMSSGIIRCILYLLDGPGNIFALAKVPTHVEEECTAMSIGPSGRGIWVENGNVRPCTSRTVLSHKGPIQTADLDDYCSPICRISSSSSSESCSCVDFDDGMGRIAVACGDEVKIIDVV